VTVAEATKAAVLTTRAKLVKSELIDAVGQMLQIDRDLFVASRSKDVDGLADGLAAWRDRSYAVVGLLEGSQQETEELRNVLIETAKGATELRDNLLEDPTQIHAATKRLRSEISAACGLLGVVKTKLKLDMEEDAA
jgi:hypothetical protein